MDKVTAYVGLGSNLGERKENLEQAITQLGKTPGVEVQGVSHIVETEPIGIKDQPRFMNCVAKVQTTLEPFDLFRACLKIESDMGRVRVQKWGPRLIDLDILLYGKTRLNDPQLTIPHPEIANRPFVKDGLRELGIDVIPEGVIGDPEALKTSRAAGFPLIIRGNDAK
jgi:2-amino-4-hydroxy-6-hydroxymethyldihydropteridine diphosphokinase